MCLFGKVLVYGDCVINLDLISEELVVIVIVFVDIVVVFGIKLWVVMLLYVIGDFNKGWLFFDNLYKLL